MTDYTLGPLERDYIPLIRQWRAKASEHLRNPHADPMELLRPRNDWRMFAISGQSVEVAGSLTTWKLSDGPPPPPQRPLVGYGGLTSIDWVNRCAELAILGCIQDVELAGGKLLLAFAFDDLGLHRVQAECYTPEREALVAELGFEPEGKRHEALWRSGEWHTTSLWGITSSPGTPP